MAIIYAKNKKQARNIGNRALRPGFQIRRVGKGVKIIGSTNKEFKVTIKKLNRKRKKK